MSTPWHIHPNPIDSVVCPVHSMAIYLFTNSELFNSQQKIFPGKHQYRRFSKILEKVLEENSAYLSNFGDVENIECHSVRKGAATYCASGSIVSPPIVSIYLRAG